ncbi:hypothetical protein ACER0A_010050 [Haloimpatiens sp. FM7315]|uniref:hypothetical protein n=1 Tax=Haloimpatiens sp. FM7315 TaxID=3298609 RepID=UPI0035A27920
MNVNKAIIKQNKSLKRVLFFNCFIFVSAILLFIFFPQMVMGVKAILMGLIMVSLVFMTSKVEENYLKYKIVKSRMYIKTGIMDSTTVVRSDKVAIVHTENSKKEMKIIIVSSCKGKRRNFKSADSNIFGKNKKLNNYFKKIKNKNCNLRFFYTEIVNGGYNKYKLLNDIYIYCEEAFFSDDAIDNIKLYKNIE